MASENEDWIRLFFLHAGPNLSRRSGARFSALCARVKDKWHSVGASIVLGPFVPRAAGPLVVDQPRFRAIDAVIASDHVEPLLASIWKNAVAPAELLPTGCDAPLFFLDPEATQPYQFRHGPVFRKAREENFDWPNWHVFSSGPTFHRVFDYELFAELQRTLPASALAFADLSHLAAHVGVQQPIGPNTQVSLDVISPLWARLEKAEADQLSATVQFEIRSRWPTLDESATLAVFPHRLSAPGALHLVADLLESHRPEGVDTIHAGCFKPDGPGPWEVALSLRGSKIDSTRAGLGRSRIVAHELLDPGYRLLRERLAVRTKGKHQFEEGVGWLFHLCGLHAARYGYPDIQHAPDVIAMYGDRGALYVECSVELPPADKLVKLRGRAEKFGAAMKVRHELDVRVAPLFCTPLPRSQMVEEHLRDIQDQRVGILCAEELEELLGEALRGEDPAEIFARLAALTTGETMRDFNAHMALQSITGRLP